MKESKFSKGNWTIEESWMDNHAAVSVQSEGRYWRAFANVVTSMSGDNKPLEEGVANAHLIKTAPKLYYKLQEILESDELPHCNESIENLLAEARGEI